MGAGGVEEVKWLKPVRPDDKLTLRTTVLDARRSRSRPGNMGIVRLQYELFNQHGDRRDDHGGSDNVGNARSGGVVVIKFFEDLHVGERVQLGSYLFHGRRHQDIRWPVLIRSVSMLTRNRADSRLMARLIASGWHTGSIWMRKLVDHHKAQSRSPCASAARDSRSWPVSWFPRTEMA